MLEQVLRYCGRLKADDEFVRGVVFADFSIENGGISPLGVVDGQYYYIIGSLFNNGLHKHPDTGLKDEAFRGGVWLLAIPPALVALADEIKAWEDKNGAAAQSPYQSESFGGYAYSKAVDSATGGAVTWQSAFRARLNEWRVI